MPKTDNNFILQNLILENREHLTVSGVTEVKCFDENEVTLITAKGVLSIKGENLTVDRFDKEIGDIKVDGQINALGYHTDNASGGIFAKIFR